MEFLDRLKDLVRGNKQMNNPSPGKWNPLKKAFRFMMICDIDDKIRELLDIQNNKNYCTPNLQDSENKQIYVQELNAIKEVLNSNGELLRKYFSADEIYELKSNFAERAKLWYELRRDGIEKISNQNMNRLKELETEPIVREKLDSLLRFKEMQKSEDINDNVVHDEFEEFEKNRDSIDRYFVLYETNKAIEEYHYNDDIAIPPVIVLPENDNVKAKRTERER